MESTVTGSGWALDALLALTLLWLGWRALASPDLFKGIVLFVAFGLTMALIWVRLEAPDIALAEAAIGAGLTGALFLAALSRLTAGEQISKASVWTESLEVGRPTGLRLGVRILMIAMSAVIFGGFGAALLSLPHEAPGLSAQVAENLSTSGVNNPVTAVLLNFRGYDTLLEMGVLLLAVVAVWSLTPAPKEPVSPPGAVLTALVRVLSPVMILAAGYLLWAGAHAPGGAFQAGSVLAAAAVLMLLSGKEMKPSWQKLPLRGVLSLGLGIFMAIGLVVMLMGNRFLEYPADHAAGFILLIEGGAALSIGAALAALFLGGRPRGDERQ